MPRVPRPTPNMYLDEVIEHIIQITATQAAQPEVPPTPIRTFTRPLNINLDEYMGSILEVSSVEEPEKVESRLGKMYYFSYDGLETIGICIRESYYDELTMMLLNQNLRYSDGSPRGWLADRYNLGGEYSQYFGKRCWNISISRSNLREIILEGGNTLPDKFMGV